MAPYMPDAARSRASPKGNQSSFGSVSHDDSVNNARGFLKIYRRKNHDFDCASGGRDEHERPGRSGQQHCCAHGNARLAQAGASSHGQRTRPISHVNGSQCIETGLA